MIDDYFIIILVISSQITFNRGYESRSTVLNCKSQFDLAKDALHIRAYQLSDP